MFVAGAMLGALAVVGAQSYFGCFRRQEDVNEIESLQHRLQQTINVNAGVEASLRAETRKLSDELSEATALLAKRVERVKEEVVIPLAAAVHAGAPPPPPPMGKPSNKRAREVYIDSKQLVQEFRAFLEAPSNKDRAVSVKNALRLDSATLTARIEKVVKGSLVNHVAKWLKEEKRPEKIEPVDWEEAVDESLGDNRCEALDRYKFPNASRLVSEIVTHLRQHYRPKSLEAQGSIIDELTTKLKRPRRGGLPTS